MNTDYLPEAFEWAGFDMLLRFWHDVIMVDWEIKEK